MFAVDEHPAEDGVVNDREVRINLALVRFAHRSSPAQVMREEKCERPPQPAPPRANCAGPQAAALIPRPSWRLADVMSRFRNRHCRPFLNAGRILRRAN